MGFNWAFKELKVKELKIPVNFPSNTSTVTYSGECSWPTHRGYSTLTLWRLTTPIGVVPQR